MVEAIIALPAFLLLSTFVLQLALLGADLFLLQYAAFCAARVGAVRGADPGPMKDAASRVLRAAPGCRSFPGPGFTLELLPEPEAGPAPSSPARAAAPLRARLAWDCPLVVPVAGPLLGGWWGRGAWLRPVFPLQASWTTWREAP